ncbi:MAG: hypothetical protein GX452_02665 [Ignavibacteriales bacterium]|jgi:septal ring factor EnvC (AmiA/AmiB activator)|nr:hypothetical protein [Ignavibacteriaceae bacterium]NLH60290.1 hypothetical protein [Ignavibacteriales bacterium]HOJ19169.1 hypothetical protein [Ignavibacteriaceae bacterium]HPO54688.1 hypothetical protein [Ignavibacteriaceae bacterium]
MKLKGMMVGVLFTFLTIGFIGCGSSVSEEQLAQLDALKKEVSSLEKEASSLKDERAKLEREIAEKNRKLEECAQMKQETQANLEKLPK